MNSDKQTEQFFELVIDTEHTAQTLRDALAAAGWGRNEIEPIQDIYSGYCRNHNIKLDDPILAEYYTVTAEGKAKEKETEGRKRINEHITEYQAGGNANELQEKINKELQQIKTDRNRFTSWQDYFIKCRDYDPSKDFYPSMLAGLRFPNGTLSYIGARTGIGKSTILVNIARDALAAGRKVFLVNLEMSNKTIITNFALSLMYANAAENERSELDGIPHPQGKFYSLFKMDSGNNTFDILRQKALKTIEQILNKNIFIYDGTGGNLDIIIGDIKSRVNTGDIVLIDYIQNMPHPKDNEQRYIQIKQTSRALLEMAINKDIVVISGAQFGRQVKSKEGNESEKREAALEDFRECGDIEQDAHNALAIEVIPSNETGRYIHILKKREGGGIEGGREFLNCNFNYLYIAGTGREYARKKTKKETDNSKAGQRIP